jgi:hypothetical protein
MSDMDEDMSDHYRTDLHAWALEQAALLRAGQWEAADTTHIAEELEDMGHAWEDQLVNRLAILLAHLLKWQFQPGHRSTSWRLTIAEQRRRVARLLRKHPSLKAGLAEALADAYGDALLLAQRDTGLEERSFPADCPWTFDEALNENLAE